MGSNWARVVLNRETHVLVSGLSPADLDTLEISGDSWGARVTFRSYRSVDYPAFDICESTLDQTFDLIIAEQVFEHLLSPHKAGRNVHEMLRLGGYFLLTTPFLLRVHNYPVDCSRWTETGLTHLLAECGFAMEHIHTGSWGNRACVRANLSDWVFYRPRLHSLKNQPEFPVVVWALAQKQVAAGSESLHIARSSTPQPRPHP